MGCGDGAGIQEWNIVTFLPSQLYRGTRNSSELERLSET